MNIMKNLTNNHLNDLTSDELTGTLGGSFAYDAGRALRFLGLDIYYGYNNGLGFSIATLDFIINMQENNA
jgi:hypothetical protein